MWERAGRHGPSGRGPAADLGAADNAEPDGDLQGAGWATRSTTATWATRSPTATWWGDALGGAFKGSDDGDSVPTPTAPRPRAALRVGYQDDTVYVVTQASSFRKHFPNLVACLAAVGHRLRPHKCFAWAPACEGLEPARRRLRLFAVDALVPVVVSGMTMLGGAIRGEMSIEVDGRADFLIGPAIKRVGRAVLLAERIRHFAVAQPCPQSSHLAWFLLSKCV